MPRKIEISHRTIIFTFLFVILIWFLYYIRDIIIMIFVSLILMAVFNPLVTRLSKYKIPRTLSVILVYLLLFTLVGFAIAAVVPPLVDQSTSFINNLPKLVENISASFIFDRSLIQQYVNQIGTLPSGVARFTVSVFSNVASVLTVLVLTFYLLSIREDFEDQLGSLFGNRNKKEVAKLIDALETKLGGWARGQISLMLIVGLMSYIGLRILGVPFALPLALIAGLFEIVPYIGPFIGAAPAVIIGFGISTVLGFATVALAFIIQQVENYFLVPKIMEKAVGVNPIITLLSLSIGFRLAGITGMLISIPVYLTSKILVEKYLLSEK